MCIVSQGILLNLNFMATLFTGSVFLLADRLGVGVGKSPPVGVGVSEILLGGDFSTGWREPEEEWFWKKFEIKTKMEQEQWLQLKMLF